MMRALVVKGGRLTVGDAPEPELAANEALVQTRAVSLNRGELRRLSLLPDGQVPGWDLAGVVTRPAADGSGPMAGTRVCGLLDAGAWAQYAAVPTSMLAEIPPPLDFGEAAALPTAVLTAYRALLLGGVTLGTRLLVTGATGAVGNAAAQLGARAGAQVDVLVSSMERAAEVAVLGARSILVEVAGAARYDVVLESVGGPVLTASIAALADQGTLVCLGNSSGQLAQFPTSAFYRCPGSRILGFQLMDELRRTGTGGRDLGYVMSLAAAGELTTQIARRVSWLDASQLIEAAVGRGVRGKAVLDID